MRYRLVGMMRIRSLLSMLGGAGAICLSLLLPCTAHAAPAGEALVVGEGAYTNLPAMQTCNLSARSIASALQRLGYTVEQQQDASSGALFAGIGTLTQRLKANPKAPVFVYVCSYATGFDDRAFMLPVSAQLSRPADVLTQGILLQTLVDAVRHNTQGPAVIAVDAIPAPKAPATLGLDRLAAGLPANVGLLAVQDAHAGDLLSPFATLLAPALKGPVVSGAKLLTDLRSQLTGEAKVTIAALHIPAENVTLAQAAAPPPPAAPRDVTPIFPPSAPSRAEESPSAVPPMASAAAAVTSLPAGNRMSAAQRRIVQQALAKLGYYDGNIDGIFGPETRAAIRRWQHELKAPMTGHLTATQATQLVNR